MSSGAMIEPEGLEQRVQELEERIYALENHVYETDIDNKVWQRLVDMLAVEVFKNDPDGMLLLGAKIHDYSVALHYPNLFGEEDEEDGDD